MARDPGVLRPAPLLLRHLDLFTRKPLEGPVLDLACGEGHNGLYLAFRYLHRPLIPSIREALKAGGILIYETFTVDQPQFGKPRNPDHLLKPGELMIWFGEWDIIHYFEGIKQDSPRAIAQLVCRKRLSFRSPLLRRVLLRRRKR